MATPGGVPETVTIKMLYEAIIDQNTERDVLRNDIKQEVAKLCVTVNRQDVRVKHNSDEIKRLRGNSNLYDFALLISTAIGTAIAAVIGSRQ